MRFCAKTDPLTEALRGLSEGFSLKPTTNQAMTIKKTEEFCPADRYRYDGSLPADFAQVDTGQDAWYFGTWASAKRKVIFCYCEGDCTTTECDTVEEFRSEILKIKQWNEDNGHKFKGIDPGWAAIKKPELKQPWIDAGLGDLLH